MKNPFYNLFIALGTARLRAYRGVFRFSDAFMQFGRVFLPSRFHGRLTMKLWPQVASENLIEKGAFRVQLKEKDLCYYWRVQPPGIIISCPREFQARVCRFADFRCCAP
jgi:hypothetical protein